MKPEEATPTCCSVGRRARPSQVEAAESGHSKERSRVRAAAPTVPGSTEGMLLIEGGRFLMGSNDATFPSDGEGPVREVSVDSFWIDPFAVTNERFARFAHETGYQTEAEKFEWSYVFFSFLPDEHPPTRAVPSAPWWRQVFGATWMTPEGPGSSIEERGDHPVVHVSWNDAAAFANWAGMRLPTEAEWEYAARGGLDQKIYPWGDRLSPNGEYRCNIWQGTFPLSNTAKDGYLATAPVDTFEPNAYGLYNVVGNVWEWCNDWWGTDRKAGEHNPKGPAGGDMKVTKGGSYLCHNSYCNRYRVAARTHNTPDSSTGHIGFRLVRDEV